MQLPAGLHRETGDKDKAGQQETKTPVDAVGAICNRWIVFVRARVNQTVLGPFIPDLLKTTQRHGEAESLSALRSCSGNLPVLRHEKTGLEEVPLLFWI